MMNDLLTYLVIEQIDPSKWGFAEYRATARYDGHEYANVFLAADELTADENALDELCRKSLLDFVRENPLQ